MNAKTSILCTLGVLALLLAGLAVLQDTAPTVYTFTITVPAWLRYGGAVIGLAALALWLKRDLWRWIDTPLRDVVEWLNDDGEVRQ